MSVRLRLWAPIWAVGHLGSYRGFRKIGLPSAFSALCVSRMMTLEQARRLGWKVEALRFLAESPTWRRTIQEHYAQTGTPPPASLAPPSREQVKQLIRWAEGRPDERDDIDRQTDAGLPYPRSSPAEISLDQILRVAGSGLPYAIFTTLHEELDLAFESRRLDRERPDIIITCQPAPRKFMGLNALYIPNFVAPIHFLADTLKSPLGAGLIDWWEIPGWLNWDRPHAAMAILRALPPPVDELTARMVAWHPVNAVVGKPGPHAALWWRAGFTVQEALDVLTSGPTPTAETLASMAALRGVRQHE